MALWWTTEFPLVLYDSIEIKKKTYCDKHNKKFTILTIV